MTELTKDKLELLFKIAKHHSDSKLFSGIDSPTKAFSIMVLGEELGISPTKALTDVHVLHGKLVMGAGLMGALIKKSGKYTYVSKVLTDEEVTLEFFEKTADGSTISLGMSSFSLQDASKAGLLGNQTWKKYPRNMLFARALSNGARWYCGDAFGGTAYVEGEISDEDERPNKTEQNGAQNRGRKTESYSVRAATQYAMSTGVFANEADAQALAKEVDEMELSSDDKKLELRRRVDELRSFE